MYFIGFVVMCVISEAAGKTVDRQKGKAVVKQKDTDRRRWEDKVLHASAMYRSRKIVRFDCLECNLLSEDSRTERDLLHSPPALPELQHASLLHPCLQHCFKKKASSVLREAWQNHL